ncbi:MAG: YbhB/YbcL family Raf kinase inhibitor-like protein, partial [Halobacteria archaeon]|nr:YbhB/YbcL family Raf kinase inhibitor-like protein [Halobacteria archaeon]
MSLSRRKFLILVSASAGSVTLAGCMGDGSDGDGDSGGDGSTDGTNGADAATGMTLQTPAFDDGGTIPAKYTCEGENVSPRLNISNVPDEA